MDLITVGLTAMTSVVSGGIAWGVLQTKVKQHTTDINRIELKVSSVEEDVKDGIKGLDDKVTKIYDHLIQLKRVQ